MNPLQDKHILLFSPIFFNYGVIIADKMREMGATVSLYNEHAVKSALARALLKVSPNVFLLNSLKYYNKIINENATNNYDYILIIKGDMTPIRVLKKFRNVFPNAKLCLYLYDSVRNIPNITRKFQYFDAIYSFDLDDCEKFSEELKFRPLFFSDHFRKPIKTLDDKDDEYEYKYDISFLGTIHSDRYAVIKQVQKIAKEKGLKCYWFLYLQSKFVYWLYKVTKREFKGVSQSSFSFKKMSACDISQIVNQSRAILDVQHPKQTGLTMRTIEMIGMNKKLITTNKNIKRYDFYNEHNIAVIDRRNFQIDMDFLKVNYEPLDETIYKKYSLKSWILEVLLDIKDCVVYESYEGIYENDKNNKKYGNGDEKLKILVTGANGYLGQGIVKALLKLGMNVVATDMKMDRVDDNVYKKECDLFSIENPYEYFGQPDILLHLAWRDGFVHYSDTHITDLPKHYVFIKAFAESNVKKIAVMGSMHEIGFFEGSIKEDTPCNPVTPYGISKNSLRELTAMLCKQNNKKFMWLRGFYIVGNSKYGSSIFSKITKAEEKGQASFPFTMGQNQFDFIDYEDFCEKVANAIRQENILGIINICSGYPEKIADRVERFIKDNGYKIKLKYGAFEDRPYDSKAVWGDAQKINRIEMLFKENTSSDSLSPRLG